MLLNKAVKNTHNINKSAVLVYFWYQIFYFLCVPLVHIQLSVSELSEFYPLHGLGFQLYSGSHSVVDDVSLPIGDQAGNYTVLLKVVVEDVYQASSAVFINVTVSR